MKYVLPTALLLMTLASCHDKGPSPSPPQLYGSTWNLSSRTVTTTNATSPATTAVAPGAYSIVFPGNGTCKVFTGGVTLVGDCIYNGSTIVYGPLGVSAAREVTVKSLTATELVTMEKTQDATTAYTSTDTFTR
ncbi:MAG: hypothetical protein ACRYG7_23880 [Janthinobacterium lividum]